MAARKITDEQFIELWKEHGSAQRVADEMCVSVRAVYSRRRKIEAARGTKLISEIEVGSKPRLMMPENQQRAKLTLENGVMVIASDCHYQKGAPSDSHRAFVECIKRLKPDVTVLNGDIFEFNGISRHPRRDTRPMPTVKDEIDVVQQRLSEIEAVAGKSLLLRTLGNHCLRMQVRVANNSPEFSGMLDLDTYLPKWKSCMAVLVNEFTNHPVMILHKWLGSTHASYLNAMRGGYTTVTGHSHKLNVRPLTDWRGTRYGIETGSLADFDHEIFDYREQTPSDWQNGFVVLTFKDGELLHPEVCHVKNGIAFFRGVDLLDGVVA